MCGTCGCESGDKTTVLNLQTGIVSEIAGDHATHTHVHADGTRHSHGHGHAGPHSNVHGGQAYNHEHDHDGDHDHHRHGHADANGHLPDPHGDVVAIESRILAKNDALAKTNRVWLLGREILALNLVSSPGSGKTTLLERTVADLAGELSLFVIEGDQATANDGRRIRDAGAPVVQVNTGAGCHLDAGMVAHGLKELKPGPGAVVLIENVGNLVCPALFDLGERAKVVVFSTTEGEDKPLKYPHMFRAAALVLLNKVDLLAHLDFAVDEAIRNVRKVNPKAPVLEVSAKTRAGLAPWYAWIRSQATAARESMRAPG